MRTGSVIIGGARTPIGRLGGALSKWSAAELGALAMRAAIDRAGLSPSDIDQVVMGCAVQAGQGQNLARSAGQEAGIPLTAPALTINRVCLSGLSAIHYASLLVTSGEAQVVVAGGVESMSTAPHLLRRTRQGMLLGDKRLEDSLLSDGLTCSLDHVSMGLATEQYGRLEGIGRERQDALALSSFERASRAWSEGRMSEEVVRVVDADGGGLDQDECLRTGITEEALARLNPVFDAGGSITAGNSSPLCDGAAAVVVTTSARAAELGVECLGEIISYGQSAGPTPSLLTKPAVAMRSALVHSGYRLHDVDIFEINEAFAAVVAASSDELGISNECVNVNGGAIALGHPFGASGARLVITTLYELRRRGGGIGLAGLCAGGGQGEAVLLRVG